MMQLGTHRQQPRLALAACALPARLASALAAWQSQPLSIFLRTARQHQAYRSRVAAHITHRTEIARLAPGLGIERFGGDPGRAFRRAHLHASADAPDKGPPQLA